MVFPGAALPLLGFQVAASGAGEDVAVLLVKTLGKKPAIVGQEPDAGLEQTVASPHGVSLMDGGMVAVEAAELEGQDAVASLFQPIPAMADYDQGCVPLLAGSESSLLDEADTVHI
mgnify:CR=1 FL=1